MLGFIFSADFPYNVNESRGARGNYLPPEDPQWNERGEAGYYYDTQLGTSAIEYGARGPVKRTLQKIKAKLGLAGIPTDFQAAIDGYTPVTSGWVATQQGYVTTPWPRAGMNMTPPMQTPGWPSGLAGLRDAAPAASAADVLAVLNAHNDRIFALSLISTTAVAVSAFLTVFRTLKLIREDSK